MRHESSEPSREARHTVPIDLFVESAVAVTILGTDGVLVFANEAARRLYACVGGLHWQVGQVLRDLPDSSYMASRVEFMRELAQREESGISRDIIGGDQVYAYMHLLPQSAASTTREFFIVHHRSLTHKPDEQATATAHFDPSQQDLGDLDTLTQRELEVLAMVSHGLTAPEIAAQLHRSVETVHTHRASILRKLDCYNSVQLAHIAARAGLKFDDGKRLKG